MYTYAQNFEDVMLERLFRDQEHGTYIDVGAWDPDQFSITRHFYERGWRGVNIEPIAARFRAFEGARPQDINLNIALDEHPGALRFFECLEEGYLSTADPEVARGLSARGLTLREYPVPALTLDQIFTTYCPATV